MFATFNLQFSTVDLGGETLEASLLAPDSGAGVDFANLLQLKVGAHLDTGMVGGEMLPQGGSELPALSLPLETLPGLPQEPLLVGPELPVTEPVKVLPGSDPELLAELPVDALSETLPVIESTETAAPPLAPQAVPPVKAPDLETGVATARDSWMGPEPKSVTPRPVIATPQAPAAIDVPRTPEPLLAERSQVLAPTSPSAPAPAEPLLAMDRPRRTDMTPIMAPQGMEAGELSKARPVVNKAVQVLNLQPQPQPQQPFVQPALNAAPPAAADATYATALQQATDAISTPVRDAAWGSQVAERVMLMASNQLKTAEIRLTPAELGPLRVQVSVDDGAANVTFQAQHAVTREAIEQALPRLRELLAESGLSLGQANVGEQGVAGRDRDDAQAATGATNAADGEETAAPAEASPTSGGRGLVDTFV